MTGDVGMAGVAIDSIEDMKVELQHHCFKCINLQLSVIISICLLSVWRIL